MALAPILFWVLLVLAFLGAFGPASWPTYLRFGPILVLILLLGLRVFPVSLN